MPAIHNGPSRGPSDGPCGDSNASTLGLVQSVGVEECRYRNNKVANLKFAYGPPKSIQTVEETSTNLLRERYHLTGLKLLK